MPFSFHARYALLTYAQCGALDPFAIVQHFTLLEAECIIGRELHADGGTHLHVFVDFGVKRRFRSSNCFDVEACHPNIIPSRGTPERGYDYSIKDGDVVAGGLERPSASEPRRSGSTSATMDTLVGIDDEQTFWDSVRELAPGLLLRSFPSLQSYAKWRFAISTPEYEHPSQLTLFDGSIPELVDWRRDNLERSGVGR